ncbi:TPA: transcriptional regulator [bacterium]|jgi:NAD-dependent deacetylase|nr:transcriptional regulator [bacterium]
MKKIVAFTGAGISKPSGVPTFEELGDIRDKLSRDYFIEYPDEFYKILSSMKDIIDKVSPNPAHLALAKYKVPIITMNIDGLHKKAGSEDLIEIHGNLENVFCPKCKKVFDFNVVRKSIKCENCNIVLETNVVLYGDSIPRYEEAVKLISTADELLVVGTSFYTSTSSNMVHIAKLAGAKVTVINEKAEEKVPLYLNEIFNRNQVN